MSQPLNILVLLDRLSDEKKRQLTDTAPGAHFTFAHRDDITQEQVQSADVILGNPSSDKVRGSKNLKYLQLTSAGAERYLAPGTLREDVLLCNGTGTYGIPISEFMVGAVFALFKNLMLYRDLQSRSEWKRIRNLSNKPVYGSTVVAVGAGDIGGSFLSRMKDLGCTTIGVRRTPGDKPDFMDEQYTDDALDSVLPRADIVGLAMPETPQTIGMFDARRLALIKDDAVIVNVGRGSAIVTDALLAELKKGRLRGAVLDVTDPEPLPKDHPLWTLDNVLITPHTSSSGSPLMEEKSFEIVFANFAAFMHGRPPLTPVDRSTGYRVSRL
jgi:phosphoglycerate dehydrogenase-like enzyme